MTVMTRSVSRFRGWQLPALAALISIVTTTPFLEYAFPDRQADLITTFFNPGLGTVRNSYDLLYKALLLVIFFYLIIAIWFMHRRVAVAQAEIPLATDRPGPVFAAAFRSANSWVPPVVLAMTGVVVYIAMFAAAGRRVELSLAPVFVIDLLFVFARLFIMATFIWVYLASLYGLHSLSLQQLRFRRHHEDHLLGMRAFGSLSLYLAGTYFLGLALGFLWVELTTRDPLLYVLAVAMLAGGVALFFYPLRTVHTKMEQEKHKERVQLGAWYTKLFADGPSVVHDDLETTVRELRNMTAYQTVERHVEGIHTWPFDTQTLGFLVTSLGLPLLLTVIGSVVLQLLQVRPAI